MNKIKTVLVLMVSVILLTACRTHHDVEHEVQVKPIHITIDVNVKVDRALDDFFRDIDKAESKIK